MKTHKFTLIVVLALLLLISNIKKPFHEMDQFKFFVDPASNSDDPDIRMAYGLNITPPWSDGGSILVNLLEHLEYMPKQKVLQDTMTIEEMCGK